MDSLIVHMLVVAPAIRYLVSPKRSWSKSTGATLAIIALGAIAFFQCGKEEPNAWDNLGLSPRATESEIKNQYRRLSKMYHPDKNPDPSARENFERIATAYEILTKSPKKLENYQRFGDFSKKGDVDESQIFDIVMVALFHVFASVLFGCLYTFSKEAQTARNIYMAFLTAVLCLEIYMRFGGKDGLETLSFVPIFGNYCVFEKIKVFRQLIPTILHGALLVCGSLYHDKDKSFEFIACQLLDCNFKILNKLNASVPPVTGPEETSEGKEGTATNGSAAHDSPEGEKAALLKVGEKEEKEKAAAAFVRRTETVMELQGEAPRGLAMKEEERRRIETGELPQEVLSKYHQFLEARVARMKAPESMWNIGTIAFFFFMALRFFI
uniref:J domain-containing protein n=1 Tax=Chromera velia CCMP2878 TaxID=1169474 RepID=A0A0G4I3K0_9ALVE|mmetsp:Transcript_51344/g.100810  ORF Transcript_51344/g.100810 Transcript_51344/m.100810 type:complete len:382 (+) Transcript_51344:39-1184(+)|eukprot:Cvel_10649.t1-p1 / transcript=Cvel_10649.t1 / gene=Cvel_10649 / organism=Chromera_velia_CCMP2878 / gene_product=Chaperone protein DnaJ, putative / transcript_product=Chaperone protein DnaJ, putative / location=Cvel_scaffold647:26037-30411(-) / protein_length=381 / sequence_SO=supercontig / SO=protein_coding / is_pseudo=false